MIYIKDLKEKDNLTQPLLIRDVSNGTTNKGAPYLNLKLADKTGEMEAKFWDVKDEDVATCKAGQVVNFTFEVIFYKTGLQIRVVKAGALDQSQIQLEDYVVQGRTSQSEREAEAQRLIQSIQNKVLRQLTIEALKEVADKYYTYPAAKSIHHAYLGGLSEHSLSMAHVCEKLCEHYPDLDRDVLIAGALVHDIGKTRELGGSIITEYTVQGNLEGHISIGNGILSIVADRLGYSDKEETSLLHHMILTHHGQLEYGSPVLPKTREAEVLAFVDKLDARMNTIQTMLQKTKPGEWTVRNFALDNRQFYKPKYKEENHD